MNIYCFSTLSFAKLQFKSVINKAFHKHGVASFTDAWIETLYRSFCCRENAVASFTDAWIETITATNTQASLEVASFTDAWIETQTYCRNLPLNKSHLLQMRGLKQKYVVPLYRVGKSHLLQMRGLKRFPTQTGIF